LAGDLAGCAVGPDYKRPAVPVPAEWRSPADAVGSLADLGWWQLFQDSVLQDLIRTALNENKDLGIAVARVAEARAQLGITRAAQFPQVDGQASYTNQRFSRNSFPVNALPGNSGVSPEQDFYRTGLDLSFELDLWGRLRRATEAAQAELLASETNRRTVVMTLVSDVAQAYFDLLELDREVDIDRRTDFKETQLRHMRPGQPATIRVDAYPDTVFRGHVDSIQAGSGAAFSLLPPENATGNYVKVVQRVPVKILAAYAGLPAEKSNSVAGMINFVRNIGSSIGTSLVTTLIARRAQFHQVHLVSRLATDNPTFQEQVGGLVQRLAESGLGTYQAQRQAYARFYRLVLDQAQTLAYVDTYWVLALAAAVMFGLAFVLRKNDPRAGERVTAH
jgi:hypothetical protein